MKSNINNVLYWSGTLLDNDATADSQLAETAQSGFNTVLLWSLHVALEKSGERTLGDLYWNDTPIVTTVNGVSTFDPQQQFTKLKERLTTLLGDDTTVFNVFFSIGAGGTEDFTAIQQLLATPAGTDTLITNFQTLLSNLPVITGFDFDDEDNYDVDTVAGFTQLLFNNFNSLITYCPYWNFDFWEQCMEKVFHAMQKQPVAWWNLQCYSGGSGNDPVQWAGNIAANQQKNGVNDPDAFIIPGYAAMNAQGDGPGMCPKDICRLFSEFGVKISGGFIWNSQHIFNNTVTCNRTISAVTDYANAIENGLNNNC